MKMRANVGHLSQVKIAILRKSCKFIASNNRDSVNFFRPNIDFAKHFIIFDCFTARKNRDCEKMLAIYRSKNRDFEKMLAIYRKQESRF